MKVEDSSSYANLGAWFGFECQGLGFVGFRASVQDLGFRVCASEFGVQGFGFRLSGRLGLWYSGQAAAVVGVLGFRSGLIRDISKRSSGKRSCARMCQVTCMPWGSRVSETHSMGVRAAARRYWSPGSHVLSGRVCLESRPSSHSHNSHRRATPQSSRW